MTELIERLRAYPVLAGVPHGQLAWLATRGRLETYEAGTVLGSVGHEIELAALLLSGRIVQYALHGGTRRKVAEIHEGEFSGLMPYSRLTVNPGKTVAVEASSFLAIHRDHFAEMICECHELTAVMVHTMVDRARLHNTVDLHDEKMASLGRLAAGLAHELNNPASAIARSARDLGRRLPEAYDVARDLGARRLDRTVLAAAEGAHDRALPDRSAGVRSPMEQADREDALADWLERHGADAELSETLADTAIVVNDLDALAEAVAADDLGLVLRWVADSSATRELTRQIGDAASRIHDLVRAVKGFTHMDRAPTLEPIDLRQGLSDTLALLDVEVRRRGVSVSVDLPPDLPRVLGFGGELNQVWMNLIDNAIDALPEGGSIEVTAAAEGDRVLVSVIDDGLGIPAEILADIFDPFFTTKGVGEGTGLGLDIARRIVTRHDGAIEATSGPGRTEFRVDLPVAPATSEGETI